eukprot:1160791-Pelagomonas_calceolata.AAC.14
MHAYEANLHLCGVLHDLRIVGRVDGGQRDHHFVVDGLQHRLQDVQDLDHGNRITRITDVQDLDHSNRITRITVLAWSAGCPRPGSQR